jgi:hypothetical protein
MGDESVPYPLRSRMAKVELYYVQVNKGGFSSVQQKRAEMLGAPQHPGP